MKKFENVVKASNTDGILAVVEGLPVDANGFFLTEEQMTNIDTALATSATAVADLATATAAKEAAEASLATAQQQLSDKETALSTANDRIATLEKLSGTASATHADEDPDREKKIAASDFPFQQELMEML